MKYLIRLINFFFFATILWGIIFGLWLGLHIGIIKGIIYGIAGGLIVSFFICIIGALYDFVLRRSVFKKYGVKNYDLVQIRETILKGELKDVFPRSFDAIKKIRKVKKVNSSSDNKIVVTTGASWNSIGEKIEIEHSNENHGIKVRILSKPVLKTAVFDGGKNIENVEAFFRSIKGMEI